MRIIVIIFGLLLTGCASNSGIIPIGKDSFFVSRQAATGFTGMGSLKAEALTEANQYCASRNQFFQVMHSAEAQPPFILGNYPKIEIQFLCLNADDPALTRTRMSKDPDTVIQIKK